MRCFVIGLIVSILLTICCFDLLMRWRLICACINTQRKKIHDLVNTQSHSVRLCRFFSFWFAFRLRHTETCTQYDCFDHWHIIVYAGIWESIIMCTLSHLNSMIFPLSSFLNTTMNQAYSATSLIKLLLSNILWVYITFSHGQNVELSQKNMAKTFVFVYIKNYSTKRMFNTSHKIQ